MSYADGLLVDGRADHLPRAKQHWFIWLWGARFTILAIVGAIVLFWLGGNLDATGTPGTIRTILGWVTAALFFGALAVFAWNILRYVNQEYVLTNRRVIQVAGVLNGWRRDSSLEKINDAALVQSVFGRMFGFGDLDDPDRRRDRGRGFRMLKGPITSRRRCSTPSTSSRSTWSAPAGRPGPPIREPASTQQPTAAPVASPRLADEPVPGPHGAERTDPDETMRTLANLADLRDRGAIDDDGIRGKEGGPARSALALPTRTATVVVLPVTIRALPRLVVPLEHRTDPPGRDRRRDHAARRIPRPRVRHALAAYRLGDGTAKLFGRLTLNPIAHFDPVGGSLLAITFIGSAAAGGALGFGWAKPTPVNPMNLAGGRRGEAMVAAAGPLSNLVLAIAGALPLRYLLANPELMASVPLLTQVLGLFIYINLLLMIFNLIPIPPLDGSKVLFAFMDRRDRIPGPALPRAVRVPDPARIVVLPAGQLDRQPDHRPGPRQAL